MITGGDMIFHKCNHFGGIRQRFTRKRRRMRVHNKVSDACTLSLSDHSPLPDPLPTACSNANAHDGSYRRFLVHEKRLEYRPTPGGAPRGHRRISQVSASPPLSIRLVLRPRSDQRFRPLRKVDVAPASHHSKNSNDKLYFGAQWHGFWTSCLTLRREDYSSPRNTRFRRLVRPYRAGASCKGLKEKRVGCKSIRCPLTNFLAQSVSNICGDLSNVFFGVLPIFSMEVIACVKKFHGSLRLLLVGIPQSHPVGLRSARAICPFPYSSHQPVSGGRANASLRFSPVVNNHRVPLSR